MKTNNQIDVCTDPEHLSWIGLPQTFNVATSSTVLLKMLSGQYGTPNISLSIATVTSEDKAKSLAWDSANWGYAFLNKPIQSDPSRPMVKLQIFERAGKKYLVCPSGSAGMGSGIGFLSLLDVPRLDISHPVLLGPVSTAKYMHDGSNIQIVQQIIVVLNQVKQPRWNPGTYSNLWHYLHVALSFLCQQIDYACKYMNLL